MVTEITNCNLIDEFLNILETKSISTLYQPIISLKSGEVLGYEALSRGPQNSYFYPPDKLFYYAKKISKIWELDFLCRLRAIERAKNIIDDKLLFINIDAAIIKDSKFKRGFTKDYLEKYNVNTAHIIFELTEHTAVTDFKIFNEILENYRQQGYKIAIDDAGDGYSGLRLMTEIRPNFIKLDMTLIRNIDKDMMKKELLKSFQQFSQMTNIQLVAEGIETYEELKTLIEIGIPYGQGYYIQRPSEDFTMLSSSLVHEIQGLHQQQLLNQLGSNTLHLGRFKRYDGPLQYHDTCHRANEIFTGNNNQQGIVVLKNSKPVGLIMRHKFYNQMLQKGNPDLFLKQPISVVMDYTPLVLDQSIDIKQASKMAMSREESRVYDYIIVTKDDSYLGVIPFAYLLNAFI